MAIASVKATINGTQYTLTLNASTGKYEATISAPSTSSYTKTDHYYPVSVVAADTAGNSTTVASDDVTLGTSLRLAVKEKIAPVITISAPTAGARVINNKPTIAFTVTDNDSGVNPSTIKITVNGTVITSGITTTANGSKGYDCSYVIATALADGSNIVKVDASDYDGNAATQKTVTFTVDTVAPTLSITAPTDASITNVAACTVTGITNDITSSPCTVTVKLNGGTAAAVTVDGSGNFSKALTLVAGTNTIVVVATDGASKTTTVTRTVTLDQICPVISAITLTPNPVDCGATFIITVTVDD